jgi:hypothetical protein
LPFYDFDFFNFWFLNNAFFIYNFSITLVGFVFFYKKFFINYFYFNNYFLMLFFNNYFFFNFFRRVRPLKFFHIQFYLKKISKIYLGFFFFYFFFSFYKFFNKIFYRKIFYSYLIFLNFFVEKRVCKFVDYSWELLDHVYMVK